MSFADIAALTIHDVKNRLTQLAGQAEARGDTETLRTAFETAETLTQLLAFYRSENGILNLNVDAHSPVDLLTELGNETARFGTIRIIVDCQAAPTLWFYDETLVRMVLANALHNALRYAREQIVITACEQGNTLEFIVRDDGEGYPESVLADTGASATISRAGTGLGLRLAQRVAQLHTNAKLSGEIRLRNDHGGVFSLILPK